MTNSGSKKMSKGAQKILLLLRQQGLQVIPEYEFSDLKGKNGVRLRYDFAIRDIYDKIIGLVEYDGEMHFKQVKFFQKNTSTFKAAQERDRTKNKYALMHNIPLYRIPYWEIDNINSAFDVFRPKFRVTTKYHNDLLKAP